MPGTLFSLHIMTIIVVRGLINSAPSILTLTHASFKKQKKIDKPFCTSNRKMSPNLSKLSSCPSSPRTCVKLSISVVVGGLISFDSF